MKKLYLLCVAGLIGVTACSGNIEKEARYPTGAQRDGMNSNDIYSDKPSIFGNGGLNVFGSDKKSSSGDGITVNSYLWRASLDTVSFMPLANVDPFGGVILTDWYSDPQTPNERYKLNVFVSGSQLRSDAIRVSAFQQRRTGGTWTDSPVDPIISTKIEDSILTRARQIKVSETR